MIEKFSLWDWYQKSGQIKCCPVFSLVGVAAQPTILSNAPAIMTAVSIRKFFISYLQYFLTYSGSQNPIAISKVSKIYELNMCANRLN